MPDPEKEWLVSFDTDRIKNFIFATNSLKEIRGASALLVQQDEARKTLHETPIYAEGGGGAITIISDERPEALLQQIERDFRMATKTGTITAEALSPAQREQLGSQWFGRHMAEAAKALQRKKSQKGELGLLPVEPYMRLCDSCGQQPAEKRVNDGDLLCTSCAQKREKGKAIRDEGTHEGFVWRFKDFVRHSTQNKFWLNADPPQDLNELGSLDGSGYIGFVVMDGNQMGKLLGLLETQQNYHDYAALLAKKVRDIVFEVLEKETEPIHGVLPFEIVLVGGDDVMLFTTSSLATKFALRVMERFETDSLEILQTANLLRPNLFDLLLKEFGEEDMPIAKDEPFLVHRKLTMAAGVVLCHSNFPIPALVEIGERLLKSAKKKCAEEKKFGDKTGKYEQGAIDFQVITGSAIDLEMARATVPHNRPYTRSEMLELLNFTSKFRQTQFPRSQLQAIYNACHHDSPVQGTMAALQTLARLKNRRHRELLREFFFRFSQGAKSPTLWPWTLIGEKKEKEMRELKTAFVDLVDLYDFIGKEATRASIDTTSTEN